jgi:hypothetical protein
MRRTDAIGAGFVAAFVAALTFAVGTAGAAFSAPGGPGAQCYLDLARKDCFGTARDATSKVWYSRQRSKRSSRAQSWVIAFVWQQDRPAGG